MAVAPIKEEKISGAFLESLVRNNSKIKKDRAEAIVEDTEVTYKRTIEDMEMDIRKFQREQENMLDLLPSDARSLVLASDFDHREFVMKDIELGVKIRETEIKLEVARKRFNYLFGK